MRRAERFVRGRERCMLPRGRRAVENPMALRVTPTLRLARASIVGACMRRVCCHPGRCQPSRNAWRLPCRARSTLGVLLNEYVGPVDAHIRLLSNERCDRHELQIVHRHKGNYHI